MATSVVAAGTLPSHGTGVGRASNGRLWTRRLDGTTIRWFTSIDDGATWAAGPTETITDGSSITGQVKVLGGFHIDANDRIWSMRTSSVDGGTTHRARLSRKLDATVATGSFADATFGFAETAGGTYNEGYDVVAHDSGSDTIVHMLRRTSDNLVRYGRTTVASHGAGAMNVTPTGTATINGSGGATGSNPNWGGEITFRHTGDGKTVAASTPDLWVSWGSGSSMFLRRAVFASGSWTWQTHRNMGARSIPAPVRLTWDGSRAIVASGNTTAVVVAERDVGDTTTTTRTPPALSDGTVEGVAITGDPNTGALVAFAQGGTSDDPKVSIYNRVANTWSSWSALEATTMQPGRITTEEAAIGGQADVVYETTAPAIRHHGEPLNVLPTAPSWIAPSSDRTVDLNTDLVLTWQHNDANGDPQTEYKLRRRVDGGAWSWWNATTWTTETAVVSGVQTVTIPDPIGTATNVHEYQVATSDAVDFGPYSASRTLTMGVKVNPSITTPTDAATIGTSRLSVEGTVAESSAYRWRILTTADAQVYSTGKVSGALPASPEVLPHDLDNATSWKVELVTWSALDVESDPDVHGFDVSFVVGPTPTLAVAANTALGRVEVTITNPAPTGGQPAFVVQDVWVRVASGGVPDVDRPVGGDGISPDLLRGLGAAAVVFDYPGSGVDTEYRVRAEFDNGTAAWSAWT